MPKRGKRQKVQIFGKKRASSLLINRNESLATQGNQSMQQIRQLSLMLYSNNTLVTLYSNQANCSNQLLQKVLCWTPNMRGGYFWSFGASTMVSTLSSGGGLTSLTT